MHFCSFKIRSVPKAFLFSLLYLIGLISTKSFHILFFSFNPFLKSLLLKVLYNPPFPQLPLLACSHPKPSPLYCPCPRVIHFSVRKPPNSIVEIAFCHLLHVVVYLQGGAKVGVQLWVCKTQHLSLPCSFIIALFLYKQL